MANETAYDVIMPPAKMKPILALSKRRSVQAAFGLTSEGEGVILLDKKAKPKRVMANLKASAEKAKIKLQPSTLRFGRAKIDTDEDATMVRFFVNKESPGSMRPKLLEVLKKTGHLKVEFNVDAGLEDELEDDDGADEGAEDEDEDEDEGVDAQTDVQTDVEPEPDPNEAKWQLASGQIQPHVETALSKGTGQPDKIRAVWAFAHGKAESGDFAAAVKSLGPLAQLLTEARDSTKTPAAVATEGVDVKQTKLALHAANWTSISEKLGARMAEVLKTQPTERRQIEAVWAFATEKAQKGAEAGSEEDYTAAFKALTKLKELLDNAAPEKHTEGVVATGQESVEADRKLKSAQALMQANTKTAKAALERLRLEFAPALPPAVDLLARKIDGLVAPSAETDPAKIELAANTLSSDLIKLDEAAVKPRADRAAWKDQLSIFEVRMITLGNHPLKGEVGTVKPLLDAINLDLGKAKLKADAMEWEEATKALTPLLPRCDAAETAADGLAHYNAIRQDRVTTLGTLPLAATITQDQPKKAVEAANKLLTDADNEKNAGKFADAVKLLNQIPKAADDAQKIITQANNYDAQYVNYQNYVIELGNFTGIAAEAIRTGLADFTKKVQEANEATTKDYRTSMNALNLAYSQYASLKARAEQAKEYTEALAAFKIRFKAVDEHKGRIAIEEFYVRMDADEKYADQRAKKGEYKIGTGILNASEPLQLEKIALAVVAEDYKAKHKKAGEDITAIEKEKNADKATTEISAARGRITAAESVATAKDWPGAVKAIELAAAAIQTARALLQADKEIADRKDTGKLDTIATDFAAAIDVFDKIHAYVTSQDGGSTFRTRLDKAQETAQSARDEAKKTPTPDFGKARGDIDAAIAACEAVLALVQKKKAFDTALPEVKTAHQTTLPGMNTDDCIVQRIEDIGGMIAKAETAAKAERFDFDGAQQQIAAALLKVREAELEAKAYAAMKPHVQTLNDTLAYLKDPSRAPGLAAEIKRLEDAATAINNDVMASNVLDAAKKAEAAAKLCPALKQLGDDYRTAVANRKSWLTDKLPAIQGGGKEACKIEVDAMLEKDKQIQKLMDSHVYGAVTAVAGEAYWLADAATKMLAAALPYEPARLAAEQGLTAALPNRNQATEERYDALRDTYDGAVEIAAERNYQRAKTMLDPIPAACLQLAADAQAYRDYEEARKKAGTKLGEAMKSKQAAAIKPLLEHLKGRHDAAIKLSAANDWAGAKKLLDELLTDATAALISATEVDTFAQEADNMKKKPEDGGKPLPDAIADAEKLYKELMAKPEALYAVATLGGINKTIEQAKTLAQSEPVKSRDELVKAVDACAKARVEMGHYTQMEAEMKVLTTSITDFQSSHPQAAFVKDATDRLLTDIEGARANARGTGTYQDATKQIVETDTAFLKLKDAADAQVKYLTRKAEVEPDLEKMEKHASRYSISAEIVSFRKDVTDAAGKTVVHDHKAAMALLDRAADTAAGALLKAKMQANEQPTPQEIGKILAGPDGSTKLDEILGTLGPQAKRKVLSCAFEARFGCKLDMYKDKNHEDWMKQWQASNPGATAQQIKNQEDFYKNHNKDNDDEKKEPNIRRFYDLMCELPDTHTKDNDSMQVFTKIGGAASGSEYGGGKREVIMREGEAGQSGKYGVSLSHEIDEVDPGCETLPGEDASYFDWNTLHEVGHAVDQKVGFMRSKGTALAGWTEHGGNVQPIAEAVAKKYKFDEAYVASYMAGTTDPVMPEPKDCDAEEWERRRVASLVWVDRARSTNNPWQTAASAKETEIGDICYQESYPNSWTSYPLAERKKGVSGYQFRSPAEWFSELYAAYHTKKLKPSHPAYSWLSTL